MADRRVKYTYDDGPFSEVGITGKQTSWRKNDSAFVPEADAALLISSGKFVDGTDFGSNDVHKQAHREIGGVPRQIAVSGVPFVIPAGDGAAVGMFFTGTSGAFTLSAAILTNAWNALKGCWCYMPSGFGSSGYAAGWYWAVFSSDTAGVLYSDTYVSGHPVRDFSPTAFPVNLNGWLTQTTSAVTGPTGFTLAGGSLGRNGSLRTYLRATGNTIGTKTFRAYLGSVAIFGATPVTAPTIDYCMSVVNLASETLQTGAPVNAPIGIGSALSSFAAGNCITVDTTVDQTISFSLQISTNTACAILLHADVTVTYGA